MNATDTEKM